MASYDDIKGELRNRINLPENQLRGMTEATGLRILDAIYQTGELLQDIQSSLEHNYEINSHELSKQLKVLGVKFNHD